MRRTFEEFVELGERSSRGEFVSSVKTWQAEQEVPKKMKVDKKNGSLLNILCCDKECDMLVKGRCRLNKQWYVDKANSNPEHNINCMNDGTIQPKTLAHCTLHTLHTAYTAHCTLHTLNTTHTEHYTNTTIYTRMFLKGITGTPAALYVNTTLYTTTLYCSRSGRHLQIFGKY
jgi:hypothetical protein